MNTHPPAQQRFRSGFSMIEVVLALGIISFSLLTILALFPVGLNAIRAATDRAAASGAVTRIANGIRNADQGNPGVYQARVLEELSWKVSTAAPVSYTSDLTLNGDVAPAGDPNARLRARVDLTPPTHERGLGHARISIAWPMGAVWDDSTKSWRNAEGYINEAIVFIPKQ